MGNRARDARQWLSAVAHYRNALKQEPAKDYIWVQYGHALKESGSLAAAETAYREALDLAPEVADTHLQLGHALKLLGRIDDAARAYAKAITLDPGLHSAALELFNLIGSVEHPYEINVASAARQVERHPERSRSDLLTVVFDVSDLVQYFTQARFPTGIQRVQLQIVTSLLRERNRPCRIAITCFAMGAGHWVVVPEDIFLKIANIAVSEASAHDSEWQTTKRDLLLSFFAGDRFDFQPGDILVNLGASWHVHNYLLAVRTIKSAGVRYVPFVHDCIPVLAPEHCTADLTRNFVSWIVGVFFHADGFLTNSNSTARDLATVAQFLGHDAPDPAVIRLDASMSRNHAVTPPSCQILDRHGLRDRGFVLFVSTIESRKNHVLAFDAWRALMRKRGRRRQIPPLVCVGNPGWLADEAMARLAASAKLRKKVLILSDISDAELEELYRACLFTIYPSSYEGWGLPVTESLCHGRVPVISRVSSLPEAGGDFAEYFDLPAEGLLGPDRKLRDDDAYRNALADLAAKIERLLEDDRYRESREAAIRKDFHPRSWDDVADEMVNRVLQFPELPGKSCAPRAELGRYYALHRNFEIRLRPDMVFGEMLRTGSGWSYMSERGCWLNAAKAELEFSISDRADARSGCYFGLRGADERATDFLVTTAGRDNHCSGTLAPGEERWLQLVFDRLAGSGSTFRIEVSASSSADPAADGGIRILHHDIAVVGLYFFREGDAEAHDRFLEAWRKDRIDQFAWFPEAPREASPSLT